MSIIDYWWIVPIIILIVFIIWITYKIYNQKGHKHKFNYGGTIVLYQRFPRSIFFCECGECYHVPVKRLRGEKSGEVNSSEQQNVGEGNYQPS